MDLEMLSLRGEGAFYRLTKLPSLLTLNGEKGRFSECGHSIFIISIP